MPDRGRGAADSGLDRALQWALEKNLDTALEAGLMKGEEPKPTITGKPRAWQSGMSETRGRPGEEYPLIPDFWERLGRFLLLEMLSALLHRLWRAIRRLPRPAWLVRFVTKAKGLFGAEPDDPSASVPVSPEAYDALVKQALENMKVSPDDEVKWAFKENRVGIVMVHGIGPQLAGQTLLDWTRPIITLLQDAVAADASIARYETDRPGPGPKRGRQLERPSADAGGVDDPVYRSNIDFSGETFPVIQVRIPRRFGEPAPASSADEPRWIFTETWWASEVRPPTLRTMVGWLGEQGGVGRIVQGIQRNTLGDGPMRRLAALSVQPFVSIIVSFVLLTLVVLLAIAKLIPFGPLRSALTLRIAAAFLTDWFGGARTLLRDPAQSANVRGRLVLTIKALRAYGCRHVVIVAHSGGTIVSLTTLTDPAYPRLNVDKLITIGEALNLGWRLEAEDSDAERPTPRRGHRLLGNLGAKPRLLWRDFWATHDPAPSGPPALPYPKETDAGKGRFTHERVYNRMNIGADHGGYWDNDEHFLIPLIREIDVPNGDRGSSRFYSDDAESMVRAARKERVSLLALWRAATFALPVMVILAAALLTSSGFLTTAGERVQDLLKSVPFSTELGGLGETLAKLGNERWFVQTSMPPMKADFLPYDFVYGIGLLVLQFVFLLALLQAILPSRVDGLWGDRKRVRWPILGLDVGVGLGAFVVIIVLTLATAGWPGAVAAAWDLIWESSILSLIAVGLAVVLFASLGRFLRRFLRGRLARKESKRSVTNFALITMSAVFLLIILVLLVLGVAGLVFVYAGNVHRPEAPAIRSFVVGGIVVVAIFALLRRVGEWRWDVWDVRERRTIRRRPMKRPGRMWPLIVILALAVVAIGGAFVAATGTPNAKFLLGDRTASLWALVILFLAIVGFSLAKDIVDNDIETEDRSYGGAGSGKDAAPLVPPDTNPRAPGP